MQTTEYQEPKLTILRLEAEDVITASGAPDEFDKGVEDFF